MSSKMVHSLPGDQDDDEFESNYYQLATSPLTLPSAIRPADIMFPSELNNQLKLKLQYLTHENCMLKKHIHDLEEDEQRHRKQLMELQQTMQTEQTTSDDSNVNVKDVAHTKIVELSKKLREKAAEVAHYKTRCAKLTEAASATKISAEVSPQVSDTVFSISDVEKQQQQAECEIRALNDKVSLLNGKLFEEKNQNFRLRAELKLAVKLLQNEIGGAFENVQQFSSGGGANWKGRAQTINELQHKLNEARDKLKIYQETDGNNICEDAAKKIHIEKRIERISKENDTLKAEIDVLTHKLETSQHKCKQLSSESNRWKLKHGSIVEQLDRVHAETHNISEQNKNIQNQLNEAVKCKEKLITRLQKEITELKYSAKRQECDAENLRKTVREKEAELEKMHKESQHLVSNNSMTSNDGANPAVTLSIPQLSAERLRLLELTRVFSGRLEVEREQRANIESKWRAERQKCVRLEHQLARAQMREEPAAAVLRNSSYASLMQRTSASIADNNAAEYKLEIAHEKIKALEMRLELDHAEREQDLQEFSRILQNYR